MIIVRNKFIPLDGFKAMTIWPFIFVRSNEEMYDDDLNHEKIHGCQQLEMLVIGAIISVALSFYGFEWWSLLGLLVYFVWYSLEWFVRMFFNADAYRSIAFEQEAYDNEDNEDYIATRSPFTWLIYY